MKLRLFAALSASLLSCSVQLAGQPAKPAARPSIDRVLDALDAIRVIHDTAVSPDGKHVAWSVDMPASSGGGIALFVRDLPAGVARRINIGGAVPAKGSRSQAPAWSPDGTTLAFLSDAGGKKQFQLYLAGSAAADAPRKLTTAMGQLARPIWSPDGTRISLLFVEGSTQETGALVAYKPDAGVVGDEFDEQRIAIVDVKPAGGAGRPAVTSIRTMSPGNMFVYDYDWAPDGKSFVAEAATGSGTDNYWTAQLYVVNAATGAAKSIWKPPFQIACPRWSPDGKTIAVIHGLMSDEGSTGGDVYAVSPDGSGARNITPGKLPSARALEWRSDGTLVVNQYVDGKSEIVTEAAAGGQIATLVSAGQHFTFMSVARKSDAVSAVVQSFTAAQEVFAGPPAKWTAQTSINTAVKPMWGEPKSLHWKTDIGAVQGWLLCPANPAPPQKYALAVSVHGGPSSANVASWPTRWNAVLPSQGYCVLLPNPRGSYGNGEAFTQANIKDFGNGDLRDILAGVDAAVADGRVDGNRAGIIGWSYGGYMTMWAVTQTARFKAAVAGAGIASWQSYYGQNKIDQWMIPFFGASVYDDPAVYAKSSPITFIKKAKTPTLVLHGDRDSEVPTPQGYEFWHALKAIGVPTELVIYPGEGHAISKNEHIHDIERRLVAWFDKYLK
jgi:dipeptidyl aminopeptidase/acylaminoacyl peptidase